MLFNDPLYIYDIKDHSEEIHWPRSEGCLSREEG